MPKYIIVPATGADTDGPVFATALAVARQCDAHIEFLHVRLDVERTVASLAASDMGGGTGLDHLMQILEQDAASRMQAAESAVRAFCARERIAMSDQPQGALPSAEWHVETGAEPAWLADRGRAADLLVVGRAREGEDVAMDVLEAALMDSGRPVLIAPPAAPDRFGGTIVIAWKNTSQAARAVAAAQPFIATASSIIILSIAEAGTEDARSSESLLHALRWQNANVTLRHLKPNDRPPVETLLTAAAAAKADLLVMGGYGHSRVREIVFGGFTRHVLNGADLPVLMAH